MLVVVSGSVDSQMSRAVILEFFQLTFSSEFFLSAYA